MVATPNGLTTTCGGTATAVAGASSASLSGATLAAASKMAVGVQGTTLGVKNNNVQVNSTNGGTGNTSNASLITLMLAPVTTSLSHDPTERHHVAESSQLPTWNAAASPGQVLPSLENSTAGLVATPNDDTTCGGHHDRWSPGLRRRVRQGATPAAGASTIWRWRATISVKNNNVQVNSTNGGTGNTSNASLTVSTLAPVITKVFGAATIQLNGTTSLTFTVTNPNAAASLTGVAFTDGCPAGLVKNS